MEDFITIGNIDSTEENFTTESTDDYSDLTDVNTIDVDRDFDGNLEDAIDNSDDGDVIQLGSNTYYTSGITIDKDITIDGQEGSIVDGGGTEQSIFNLTPNAAGATIQDIAITNGNNGIYGYGASNVTLENLEIYDIGIDRTVRDGANNTGIILNNVDGAKILNSSINNVGRKGVGIGDTDGVTISGLTVQNVNLQAQHSQSHDAAGVKFYNTNDAIIENSYFWDINAINIWNDTTNGTIIRDNVSENVGEDFLKPDFNDNVNITGIYNEKSSNSLIKNNQVTSIDGFSSLRATEFSTETMTLEDNDFSFYELGTQDYWVNEEAEKLIATTEDPDEANFSLFANEYYEQANIG